MELQFVSFSLSSLKKCYLIFRSNRFVFVSFTLIVVLTRRGMRSSTNAYLTALAIADLVYLLCVFWLSLRHYPHIKEDLSLSNFYAYTWPYSLWLTDATSKFNALSILP